MQLLILLDDIAICEIPRLLSRTEILSDSAMGMNSFYHLSREVN